MTVFEAVRGFLEKSPGMKRINSDLTAPEDESWALTEQGDTVLRKSILGGVICRRTLLLHYRASLDGEAGRQDNHGALEGLAHWLEQRTRAGLLPQLPEPWRACALTAGCAVLKRTEDGRSGLYQMPILLTYEKEGE